VREGRRVIGALGPNVEWGDCCEFRDGREIGLFQPREIWPSLRPPGRQGLPAPSPILLAQMKVI
jgi:hypothetical protein